MSKSSKELLIVSVLSALIIAALTWGLTTHTKVSNLQLEGDRREKAQQQQYQDFKAYIGQRFDAADKRLDRIENKLDKPLVAGQ